MKQYSKSIAVFGAGSWGSALALMLAKKHPVCLWGLPEEIAAIKKDRTNNRYLPGFSFPEKLQVTEYLNQAVLETENHLIAVPSHAFRSVLNRVAQITHLPRICWATKGLDPATDQLLSEVAAEQCPEADLAVLSGPSFAIEVAKELPTAVTIASNNQNYAGYWAELTHTKHFRAYTSTDMIGVQIGGAIKNIMAIATGISDGLGYGANAQAALITRGLAEMTRLGIALGAQPETLMGMAGMGDLILTCTDDQSRNRRLGLALAHGFTIDEAKAEIQQEIEGILSAHVCSKLAENHQIDMPISLQVHEILFNNKNPQKAVAALLDRQLKAE